MMTIATPKKNRGFTLVELVVVIVLLGITAVTFTTLITGSVQGYLDTANRQSGAAAARIALDRIGRELRQAMPQSVRVSGDQKCVQFLPIVTSFVYTTLTANSTNVQAIEPPEGYTPTAGTFYGAVYPINAGELYSLNAMKSIAFGGVNSGLRTLTLGNAFVSPYPRNGPGQRIYIVGLPVSYCITNNSTLVRSQDALSIAQPAAGALANPAMLTDRINYASSSFENNASTWQNNSLIKIVLKLQSNTNETLTLDHEIWLRNVQ